MLDVYAPENAKDLPVIFWIHGGGWQGGDKTSVHAKPKAFVDKGYVFVSTNYRLLPNVDMETIVRDVAKSIRWVHDHIAEYGGDPKRLIVMGHSAGAQLAALDLHRRPLPESRGTVAGDHQRLRAGRWRHLRRAADDRDGAARRKALGQPNPKFGHYEKFGSDPVKHRNFSAVNHVARDKGIPPFLLLYVADHADTERKPSVSALYSTKPASPRKLFGAKDTEHSKINENLGLPDDPSTKALFEFVGEMAKK